VSTDVTTARSDRVDHHGWRTRRREHRAERARLARQDALNVRLAELHRIRALLEESIVLVNVGWVQNAWFAVLDEQGRQHRLLAHDIHRVSDQPVSGACLVGSIVHAAGGPLTVHSQLVQRTLDLTWHALYEGEREPVRWCPSPAVRAAHVRDLTRWNDHPQRTSGQVAALLLAAVRAADDQIDLRRADHGLVAGA
jgi:hypothetical protein